MIQRKFELDSKKERREREISNARFESSQDLHKDSSVKKSNWNFPQTTKNSPKKASSLNVFQLKQLFASGFPHQICIKSNLLQHIRQCGWGGRRGKPAISELIYAREKLFSHWNHVNAINLSVSHSKYWIHP